MKGRGVKEGDENQTYPLDMVKSLKIPGPPGKSLEARARRRRYHRRRRCEQAQCNWEERKGKNKVTLTDPVGLFIVQRLTEDPTRVTDRPSTRYLNPEELLKPSSTSDYQPNVLD